MTTLHTVELPAGHALGSLAAVRALGARTGLLWSRPDLVLAGLGEIERIRVERPGGAAAAQERLASYAATEVADARPGTGPVAFGAFPFDREAEAELIVPELVVGITEDAEPWLTLPIDIDVAKALSRVEDVFSGAWPEPEPRAMEVESPVRPEVWRDEIVGEARERIRSGQVNKVVLARELVIRADAPIDPARVVERAAATFPNTMVFNVEGFVGASPELLVSRFGEVVAAHPLAGTAPRSSDPALDQGLAGDLLASTKNQGEHRITIEWFLNELLPFCSYVDAEPEPSIVTMANVHHLGTRVEGVLSEPHASVLELVAALHPTPAVGGDPQGPALEVISELERAERGLYAGPTGWVDANGNGAFAVTVRSAHIQDREIRLFAGVGVVADSDLAAELEETRAKFQAMLGSILRP